MDNKLRNKVTVLSKVHYAANNYTGAKFVLQIIFHEGERIKITTLFPMIKHSATLSKLLRFANYVIKGREQINRKWNIIFLYKCLRCFIFQI